MNNKTIMMSIHRAIGRKGKAFLFYVENGDLAVRTSITENDQSRIDSGRFELIGVYQKPVLKKHVFDDIDFHLAELVNVI